MRPPPFKEDVVDLFANGVESGDESKVENGVSTTKEKREREFFEVSLHFPDLFIKFKL